MGEEEFQVLCMLREQLLDIGAVDVLDLLESGDEETAERLLDKELANAQGWCRG